MKKCEIRIAKANIHPKRQAIKYLLILSLTMIFYTSCYTVNNRKDLGIVFNDSKLDGGFLKQYVDSVRNKSFLVSDSISEIFFNGDTISSSERIIYFYDEPKEWYLINFIAAPCYIESLYNPNLSNGQIYDTTFISKKELMRVRTRFVNEVLKAAEQYGKSHNLPDSIIYDLKFK